jgi:uncharacterized protein YprB with RNaseH-like and TPR domain
LDVRGRLARLAASGRPPGPVAPEPPRAAGLDEVRAGAPDPGVDLAALSRAHRVERLRGLIAGVASRRALPAVEAAFEAGRGETPSGPPPLARPARLHPVGWERLGDAGLRRASSRFSPEHRHGAAPVVAGRRASSEAVAALAAAPALAGVDLSRALYLDTETTGLSVGAGTIPFVVGMGWFEGDVLAVEQLVLEGLGGEPELVDRVRARLEAATAVVTFNGKSYDWPLLETRTALLGRGALPARPHVDLLHAARRVYRSRLGGTRLVELEVEVLGRARTDDVGSAAIPALFWEAQRAGRIELLAPVVAHNADDVVAMVALLGHLAARFERPDPAADARDLLAFARVAHRARDPSRALGFVEALLGGQPAARVAAEACLLEAEVHRAAGALAGAVLALERALAFAGAAEPDLAARAHLALAKLLEHRLGEPARALSHAAGCAALEPGERAARRQRRLEGKLASGARRGGADQRAGEVAGDQRSTPWQSPQALLPGGWSSTSRGGG